MHRLLGRFPKAESEGPQAAAIPTPQRAMSTPPEKIDYFPLYRLSSPS